ncbi:MAG: alpha-galactosidase [Lachnospiraceae bacterium]|nr:alpha-galactosidase [Lachnospiraceae bacterium]
MEKRFYALEGKSTSYLFQVTESGHLEHLYYGKKLRIPGNPLQTYEVLSEKAAFAPGTSNWYDDEHKSLVLEDMCLEMSSRGRGDIREPMIDVVHEDGSSTSDFIFEKAEIIEGCLDSESLPRAYDELGQAKTLVVTLKDAGYGLKLELIYTMFADCDVLAKSARLYNESIRTVTVKRLMSAQLDLADSEYLVTNFTGAWAREMKKTTSPLPAGKWVNSSVTGNSSAHANPFFMLGRVHTTEDAGECIGLNLIYSGNHYEACEVSAYGKLRVVQGINPDTFTWTLAPGRMFETPEAVMTYSNEGYNGMSHQMHAFVREHVVRGTWKNKTRPVLLNSWEACYFKINEGRLLDLAREGKKVGIELFVMDDGWFGERDNDTKSLGDWDANKKKLPGGLSGICKKVNKLGLDFGIWVEPEMVNVNSNLYRAHPDWVLEIPGRPHSEGRNQRILDLTKTEVQDFIIEKMSEVFGSANIAYVKWDMNRNHSDFYSQGLPARQQGEVAHRYILGLYRVMRTLVERFPEILFEGCASGGNRFDLGILSYFPQIWASDDTDAICRAEMQNNYSYGYPLSTVTAHVSSVPNHQTLRRTSPLTRFNVAVFGVFGYELNLSDMSEERKKEVAEQIALYKEWREVLQWGTFWRGRSFSDGVITPLRDTPGNVMEWTTVAKDQSGAVGMILQQHAIPNSRYQYYRAKGLDPEKEYHFTNRKLAYNVKEFGDLVNQVAPFHIKQDSIVHNTVAKFVHMDGEIEDYTVGGDVLMAGVKLKQGFAGTGYNDQVRFFPDFGSRIYLMKE